MRPAESRETAIWRSFNCAWILLFLSGVAHATVPTAPTNLTAAAASTAQVNLSWTDNSNDETSFKIERKTGSGGTYSQIATTGTNVVTFSNTGLTAGTTYFYRVRASNSSGNSAYTNEASATPVADTTAPNAPTGLTTTAVAWNQIDLSWTASTDNVGVIGYRVERCLGASCTDFVELAAPTGTNLSDGVTGGVCGGMTYRYRVRAADAAGNLSGYSTVMSATTPKGSWDTIAPTAPRNLVATAAGAHQVNLFWEASRDDGDNLESGDTLAGYFVERCQGANCAAFAQIKNPSGTSLSDTALVEATTYRYRVRAFDLAGNLGTYSNVGSATTLAANAPPDTTAPTAPSGLTAVGSSSASTNAIYLSWNPSSDNFAVTEYRVERCQGANCIAFAEILAVSGTSLDDVAGLAAGTSYRYRVRAGDAAGNLGPYSNIASATPQADTTPPSAPTGLTGVAVSPNQINLSWTASSDNVAVTRYLVQRCEGAGCTNFASLTAGVRGGLGFLTPTSYADYPLAAASSYSYQVRAVDVVTNVSDFSSVATFTTPNQDTTPPTVPTGLTLTAAGQSQINLSWTASTDNIAVELYRVERCQGANCTSFAEVATPSGTSFSDYGLATATMYSYRARAADAAGNLSDYSIIASVTTSATADTTPPSAPAGLTAVAASSSQINLSWTASTDNVGVTGYQVDRCQGVGCTTFAQVATPPGTTFNDIGLSPTTSYSYRVRATDAVGNTSTNSDVATATTQAPPDTTAPSAPTGLTATAAGATQINLAWTASTDNVAVAGYRVERCQGANCSSFVEVAAPTATTFSDTGLSAASYSYRVRAADAAGNLSAYSNVASATASGASLTVTSPTPGAVVASDSVTVSGTFSGPNNIGIAVNGIVAAIVGNTFVASNVPLQPGNNTLTVTLTTPPSNQTTTQTLSVTSTGSATIEVLASPAQGVAPFSVVFTINNRTGNSIQSVRADYSGTGSFTNVDPSTLSNNYTASGIYQAAFIITDSTGASYQQTVLITVQDTARIDQMLQTAWWGFTTALAAQDRTQALQYFNEQAQQKFQPVFQTLATDLPQIVASFSSPQLVSVTNEIGEYAINRTIGGVDRIFLIYFMRDADGVWRIDDM